MLLSDEDDGDDFNDLPRQNINNRTKERVNKASNNNRTFRGIVVDKEAKENDERDNTYRGHTVKPVGYGGEAYKVKEVVRGKEQRKAMDAFDCPECRGFYAAFKPGDINGAGAAMCRCDLDGNKMKSVTFVSLLCLLFATLKLSWTSWFEQGSRGAAQSVHKAEEHAARLLGPAPYSSRAAGRINEAEDDETNVVIYLHVVRLMVK